MVNSYKYLGFLLTTQLSFNIACDEFASKAKGKVLDIIKTMWCIGSLNTYVFFRFFDSQVKPMLLYASEIWGLSRVANIESAHLFAIKRLLSVSDKTPNTMIYGESGRHPLYVHSTISAMKYWLKLLRMSESRIPKRCLLQMTRALDRNGRCFMPYWVQGIRDCLIKHGFDDVWHNQGVQNEAAFLRQLKTKLIDEFNTEWYQKMLNSDRFAFYRSFKERPFIESYLNDITIKRFRDVLIRFRLGINELKANKRFHTDNDFSKSCPFCPNTLENEMKHILFLFVQSIMICG